MVIYRAISRELTAITGTLVDGGGNMGVIPRECSGNLQPSASTPTCSNHEGAEEVLRED